MNYHHGKSHAHLQYVRGLKSLVLNVTEVYYTS